MTTEEKPTCGLQRGASLSDAHDAQLDVAGLSILELLYHLYKEDGASIIGHPDKVFAIYYEDTEQVMIFSKENKSVRIVPYLSEGLQMALVWAKDYKAHFSVLGEKIVCTTGPDFGYGSSYGEAALRAMLKMILREKNCGHTEQPTSPQNT